MSKTTTTSMGKGAGIFGGLVNAMAGNVSHTTKGPKGTKNGHGSTREKSRDDYNRKNSKK